MLNGQKIIDMHAHTVAPPELYAFKSTLLSGRGYHGKGAWSCSDERIVQFAQQNIDIMDKFGTDVQFLSPRPFQLMHSEKPESIVHWFAEVNNDVIARHVKEFPDRFQGVAGLPQLSDQKDSSHAVPELERAVKELGFIGCLINPDPGEGTTYTPPMDDEYWFPLYEAMVKLDVAGLIHSAACKDPRESYSAHFITTESQAILNMIRPSSKVFQTFPDLKIVVAHGGGSVPYQIGRWRVRRNNDMKANPNLEDFDTSIRRFYYDTNLYNKEALDYCFQICGPDRVMFGTENPGSGTSIDPKTGKQTDDLAPVIDEIAWLTPEDKKNIFEDNARRVFTRGKF
ncbi:MAG: amidohydrolase [SAR202 cluster bacterium]|nr:amidohydrolase [SAR202 cluster bacterium]|tara:strand:- start:612 stop:1634 length:1023 start_codon:yes stop_codon:yes gene_type:complete